MMASIEQSSCGKSNIVLVPPLASRLLGTGFGPRLLRFPQLDLTIVSALLWPWLRLTWAWLCNCSPWVPTVKGISEEMKKKKQTSKHQHLDVKTLLSTWFIRYQKSLGPGSMTLLTSRLQQQTLNNHFSFLFFFFFFRFYSVHLF